MTYPTDPGYFVIWRNDDDPYPYRYLSATGHTFDREDAIVLDLEAAEAAVMVLLTGGTGAWIEPIDHFIPTPKGTP